MTRHSYGCFVRTANLSELRNLDRAVKAELEDLGSEIAAVQPLVDKLSATDPDSIEIRAIAGTLHAFYNGVERVLVLISKHFGEDSRESHSWHRDLLTRMAAQTEARPAVLSTEMSSALTEFLAFRHFFRHAYPMRLRWERIQPLVESLVQRSNAFAQEVEGFLLALHEEQAQ